jgi:hypothetical protein
MTYRSLAVSPLVLAALSVALVALASPGAQDGIIQGEIDLSKGLACGGMLLAALAFDQGDYLRRGWGVWAATYALLLARDAMLLVHGQVPPLVFDGVRGVLVTAGNVCVVIGAWTLARAWNVAGLEHPGSRGARRAVVGVAGVLALVFAGPTLVIDLRDLVQGTTAHLDSIPSDLGDILSLPLIAPVALTALAVRGGTLRWPWMLLTASLLAWLVYDAAYTLPDYFYVDARSVRLVGEQFHVLAGLCACAAGLAQRRAVTEDDEALSS